MATVVPKFAGNSNEHPGCAFLCSYELLTDIFQYVLPPDPTTLRADARRLGQKTLLNLALTCKAFVEPALNILWFHLESPLQIFHLLPNARMVNGAHVFHGSIPPGSPFRTYAARVRSIDFACSGSTMNLKASSHLYLSLLQELEGQSIFPSLKSATLTYQTNTTDDFLPLPLILCPSVEAISLHGPGLRNSLFTHYCLPMIAQKLPSLRRFTMDSTGEVTGDAALLPVRMLPKLEMLNIVLPRATGTITPNMLYETIAVLPALKSLTLDLHFPNDEVTDALFQKTSAELNLSHKFQSVHLVTRRRGGHLCGCLPRFLLEKATQLTIALPTSLRTASQDYFAPLAKALEVTTAIHTLNVTGAGLVIQHSDVLLPILKTLPLLHTLNIDVNIATLFPPTPLSTFITGAFNRPEATSLKTLSLYSPRCALDIYSGITLDTLIAIAKEATGLEHLSVGLKPLFAQQRMNGKSLASWLALLQTAGTSRSTLRTLTIFDGSDVRGPLTVQEADDLAQALDLMFPLLREIRPYEGTGVVDEYWRDRWSRIERLRRMYQAARLHGWSVGVP
ncbi:hypothetical protein DFP72DRAFT_899744 [Ephemerocybe angulata]|uniref:F-box domain-containing protein n=1 Tax=Ephemerocybe angulata TaxID=980116 RepID=A0A8H6HWI9_9AGAR|nr:hypothetical protein DFP72DRAFT_899744 [Tulosesus angulatus]